MKLVYPNGKEAQIGDHVELDGVTAIIMRIDRPHKPGSTGRVYVRLLYGVDWRPYFPGVFNLEWKGRKDK